MPEYPNDVYDAGFDFLISKNYTFREKLKAYFYCLSMIFAGKKLYGQEEYEQYMHDFEQWRRWQRERGKL
jgi:hypothetical protein